MFSVCRTFRSFQLSKAGDRLINGLISKYRTVVSEEAYEKLRDQIFPDYLEKFGSWGIAQSLVELDAKHDKARYGDANLDAAIGYIMNDVFGEMCSPDEDLAIMQIFNIDYGI